MHKYYIPGIVYNPHCTLVSSITLHCNLFVKMASYIGGKGLESFAVTRALGKQWGYENKLVLALDHTIHSKLKCHQQPPMHPNRAGEQSAEMWLHSHRWSAALQVQLWKRVVKLYLLHATGLLWLSNQSNVHDQFEVVSPCCDDL